MALNCLRNLDAERAILGAAMQDASVAHRVAALPEALFTDALTKSAHKAIKRLVADGKTPDLVTVDAEMQSEYSDTAGVIAMQQAGFAPSMAGQYEAILCEAATRRTMQELGARLIKDATDPAIPTDTLIAATSAAAKGISTGETTLDMNDVMMALIESLDKSKQKRMQVGIAGFDDLTGGIMPKQLIYIGARPGVGKTALGLVMAMHVASHSGPVLMVSLEMGPDELGARMMAYSSGVDLDKLSTGRMSPDDYAKIAPWYGTLSKLPIRITDRATTPLQVRREAAKMQANGGLRLVVVDYVQLLSSDTRRSSRYEEVSEISRGLKLMAMDLQVPVIAMCQLNRKSENPFGKTTKALPPSMAEARDSGALEQDANMFLTLYEPKKPDLQENELVKYSFYEERNLAWQVINIEKNRQGRTGRIDVGFDKPHMRYLSFRR